jgi:hypothetical protein
VRWSILAAAERPDERLCEACGSPLKVERRRPGRRLSKRAAGERRDFHPVAGPPA